MNKKFSMPLVLVIIIVIAIIVAIVVVNNIKKGNEVPENKEINDNIAINTEKDELDEITTNSDLEKLNASISKKEPFNEMPTMDIDAETLASLYEIQEDEYEEAIGKMPMMNIQASMYLVIKPKEGMADSVKQKVEKYGEKQEQIWSTYLPEQYELVKQRKIGTYGDYVYLVIAETADEIETLIKQ